MLIDSLEGLPICLQKKTPIASWDDRKALINKSLSFMQRRLLESVDALALAQCRDTGKAIRYCYNELDRCIFQIENAQAFLKYWQPEVDFGDTIERESKVRQYRRYFPVGNVLGITSFSSPYSNFFQKFLPALITGNRFFFKPSPRVHSCSTQLYKLVHDSLADSSSELAEFLHCVRISDSQAGEVIKLNFDAVIFTGKSETAKLIKECIGRAKGIFETGSNAMAYVDKSARLNGLPEKLAIEAFAQSGMRCVGLKNLFVHEAITENFIQVLSKTAEALPYGDPMDKKIIVGPVTDADTLNQLEQNIKELTSSGYKILCGGDVESSKSLLRPTLLLGSVSYAHAIKESYGPLMCVFPVKDYTFIPEEYYCRSSLNTSVYAEDNAIIHDFSARCRSGAVCVNYGPAVRMDSLPFGGIADENEGRESLPDLATFLTREQLILIAQ